MTIGQRVAFYRRRRGLSQEVLAGLVGKTQEWLRKVETNRADLDRLSGIRAIAKALDVSLGDLIGAPSLFEWSDDSGRETIPALRAALHDYRHLAPTLASTGDVEAPALREIENDVAKIWTAYQHSRYGTLARRLPYLIHDCLTATEAYDGDDGQRAQAMTAYAHQLAALFLTKLGEGDLAWTAASRGLAAANASHDHVVIGSLSHSAAHSLVSIGEYAQARDLAATAAQFLEPRLARPTPQLLSVYGSLHLVCALAAARDDDRTSAHTHITEADAAATRLGADGNHVWTAFGPINVSIHKTTVAMEIGDVQRAIAIGAPLNTRPLPIERQVRHAIETARAIARWNRIDAALLDAEVIGPDQVRYHRLSRDLIRDILTRPRPPRLAVELSDRWASGREDLAGSWGSDQPGRIAGRHQATEGRLYLVRHLLRNREPAPPQRRAKPPRAAASPAIASVRAGKSWQACATVSPSETALPPGFGRTNLTVRVRGAGAPGRGVDPAVGSADDCGDYRDRTRRRLPRGRCRAPDQVDGRTSRGRCLRRTGPLARPRGCYRKQAAAGSGVSGRGRAPRRCGRRCSGRRRPSGSAREAGPR